MTLTLRLDPFDYHHFGIDTLGLRIGEIEQLFSIMECNFINGKVLKPLTALLEAAGYLMGE